MQSQKAAKALRLLNAKITQFGRKFISDASVRAVPGEGPLNARLFLIGQNPGQRENKTGRPFVGRSGKFLDKTLVQNGIDRSKVFITSVGKFATPNNKKPTSTEIKQQMPFLIEQLDIIRPRAVVLMGAVAWQVPRQNGIYYLETYHPAAAMRFETIRKRFLRDFKKLARFLKASRELSTKR